MSNCSAPAPARAIPHKDGPTPVDVTPGTSHRDSPLRREIARVACEEVAILAKMLRAYIEAHDRDGETAPAMRSGLMRLSELSHIIYETAITDDAVEEVDADSVVVAAIGGYAVLHGYTEGGAA